MFIDFIMRDSFTFDSFNVLLKRCNLDATSAIDMAYSELRLLTKNIFKINEHRYFIHKLFYFILFFFTHYNVFNVKRNVNAINSIRENVNKYLAYVDDEVLSKDSRILNVIVFDKAFPTFEMISYLKTLIDRNESYFNIKEIFSLNEMCIYSEEDSLFDYVFNKMMCDDNMSIYYMSLLKLFYNPFISDDKKQYYLDRSKHFGSIFQKELSELFNGNKDSLDDEEIRKKFEVFDKNMFINIPKFSHYDEDIGCVFTLDTYGTRYKDDAISVKLLENDMLVGIHVSDIASFMAPGSVNDMICLGNFKKVFLGDSFSTLFDDKCASKLSLNKNSTKKVISVFVLFDKQFKIKDIKFVNDTIKINENLSFNKADTILREGYSDCNYLFHSLERLFVLANVLRSENNCKGRYWEHKHERSESTHESKMIVDELSILYNGLIARAFLESGNPFVYRCQDIPDYKTLLCDFDLPCSVYEKFDDMYSYSRYSTTPEYHYGLNKECYAHCTSPLRRYPDLFDQYLIHMFHFKDKKYFISPDLINDLVDYFNIRNEEMRLFKMEYNNARSLKKGYTPLE